ncbi:hypothetical protein JCGZ_17404 [Jatropha curcas]|uniref:peptidylprolyl isomerase n=1 Tax=Jatropha curcas TaxID=180498 RepID=A0A067LBP1_JATCU|nr:peptidyl-prolyl cis-trans isomerase FKBP43 isoform X1 [Jatropha curcas]KDP45797.1 hypothetical protein JCGZ_17404 [Jatropha curcas]
MTFWGAEVKPGHVFEYSPDRQRRRLHISQATLGNSQVTSWIDRAASDKVVVQCEVGYFGLVSLCSLFPERVEFCKLNLEFEETPFKVLFQVIGNRSVHLTGFYKSATSGSTLSKEPESLGEDGIPISSLDNPPARNISEAEEMAKKGTDLTIDKEVKEDVPERKADVVVDSELTSQPEQHESILSSAQAGLENGVKPKKRSKKRSKVEDQVKAGTEDFSFGTIIEVIKCSDKAKQSETKAGQSNPDTTVIDEDNRTESDKGDNQSHFSPPCVVHGNVAKSRKKTGKRAKEEKGLEAESPFHGNVNRDEPKGKSTGLDILLKDEENQKKANYGKAVLPWNSELPSTQLVIENGLKPKRNTEKYSEDITLGADSNNHTNVIKEDKASENELKFDGTECYGSLQDEQNQRIFYNIANQSANSNHSRKKKKKRSRTRDGEALNAEGSNGRSVMETEDNNADEKNSSQLRTLSNGLIIKKLVAGVKEMCWMPGISSVDVMRVQEVAF